MSIGRDTIEVLVAAQWEKVLGAPPVSIDDNFFSLGGDSFKAARVASGLRVALGKEVPLHEMFERASVRTQAEFLRSKDTAGARGLVTMKADGDGAPLVLLPGGGGSLVGLGAFAGSGFDRPVYGLRAPGLCSGEDSVESMTELSAHFVDVLSAAGIPRRVHLAGYCFGGVFAYHLAEVLTGLGWEVLSVTLLDSSLAAPDLPHGEIVGQRLAQLMAGAGIDEPNNGPLTPETLFARFKESGRDLLEEDAAAFQRRLNVYASLWRIVVDYRPQAVGLPVLLYSLPDRLDLAPQTPAAPGVLDWSELGCTRFRQVNLPELDTSLTAHPPVLEGVEKWLQENEGTAC
ncbi:alpha/beta fold hydrolase [Streptomyces sp. NPDC048349]|uniref:thioesterase domain-containing protein n=1 Tax=Streptomyces sp. NPDC048349 TaxID=3155486 RepID=UPI0034422534